MRTLLRPTTTMSEMAKTMRQSVEQTPFVTTLLKQQHSLRKSTEDNLHVKNQ